VKAYAPYYYKSSGGVRYAQLAGMQYDYFKWDWYRIPIKQKKPVWSEPYFDEGGGGVLMCTYSVPFYERTRARTNMEIKGVVTADVCLDWLSTLVASVSNKQASYGFIISGLGNFITHPNKDLVFNKTISDLAAENGDSELLMLGEDMVNLDQGFVRITSALTGNKPAYVAYQRVPSTGWAMAVVFPEDDILSGLKRLNQRAAMLSGLGIILLFLVVLFISRSITEPLRRMAAATNRVAEGDLNVNLGDLEGPDEVGRLAAAFNQMSFELDRYIRELTETTAAKERIQSELNIASQIQRSILPSTFPPFPQKDEFELFALIQPAREVGGDFYDFFLLDDNQLALVMADVSDKGVPAALFMMVSRTLIKSIARRKKSPAEVLAEANDLLCQGNDAAMFVTLFLAYYDLKTGEIVYANGGHNPAVIVAADGSTREFGAKTGAALGLMPDLAYKQNTETLAPDEILVLYTDGVNEAVSPDKTMFGMERF
jgi:sigma-B regulation protein RsbU (phosphoserine phosphatase)